MPTDTAAAEITGNLLANREAHRARWGIDPCLRVTAGRLRDVGASTARGGGRSGLPLQIRAPGGVWRQVHDTTQPLREARGWLAGVADAVQRTAAVCVLGAGAGWVVDAIEELPGMPRVLLLEPEPLFCAAMFERRDFRALIAAGRLMVLSGPEFDGAADAWRVLGRITAEPPLLVQQVIAVARREATVAAARIVRRATAGALANERARRQFAAPYLLNTLRNLPALAREADAGLLFDRYRDAPVVIAGAGPSLNRNLEELRPYRDRVVFIATDTALKPSLAAGLAPDFVVAVDPGVPNARHLTRLPPCDTALVAEASVHGDSLAAFAGRTFLYRVAAHQPWPWLMAAGMHTATLRAWGSVLVTAFDLGVKIGGDPVVLIGADLAYTGGLPYCRGTVYEEDWALRVGNGETLEAIWRGDVARHPAVTEEHAGQPIATAAHFTQFRDALLHAAHAAPARVLNATGAGILRGHGIEQGTLRQLLAQAPPLMRRELPRREPAPAAVAALRQAARDLRSAAALPEAWTSILREHEPPDASLPGQLSAITTRLLP